MFRVSLVVSVALWLLELLSVLVDELTALVFNVPSRLEVLLLFFCTLESCVLFSWLFLPRA